MKKIICFLCLCIFAAGVTASADYISPKKEMTVLEAMGLSDISEIKGGCILSLEKQLAVDMTRSQIASFYTDASSTVAKRRVTKNPFCGLAVVLQTDKGEKTYFISSGVQVGMYGDDNYFCYLPREGMNCIGQLYAYFMSSDNKYSKGTFNINKTDYLVYPEEQWAVENVLFGAYNSLLPYEITYSFGKAMSREEFCIIVSNLLCVVLNYEELDDYFKERNISYFSDYFIDTDGCDESINMLHAMGIINGKDDKHFCPADALTREEAAVILKNAASACGISLIGKTASFKDAKSISKWAINAVYDIGANGIMSGEDGSFMPKSFLTTEQAITAVNRLFKLR